MERERWLRIEEIFSEAIRLTISERVTFVRTTCGNDEELHAEVRGLLAEHEASNSDLDEPVFDFGLRLLKERSRIGPYSDKSLGRFDVGNLIGRGGMGEVYAAFDREGMGHVALKFITPPFSMDDEHIARFRKEAAATSLISHPNVAAIHELCRIDEQYILVMELVEGRNLRQHHVDSGDIGSVLDLVIGVARSLVAAHSAGVVHRDIKPENIMVQPDGSIKVLDFGLAKLVEPVPADEPYSNLKGNARVTAMLSTELGMLIGTTQYMSPEQVRGSEVGPQADIWSLGVVLYELLTDDCPFQGHTKFDIIASILKSEPARLPRHLIRSKELNSIIEKTLKKNNAERYATAADMLADLVRTRKQIVEDSQVRNVRFLGIPKPAWTTGVAIALTAAVLLAVIPAARRTVSAYFFPLPRPPLSALPPVNDGIVAYWPADGTAVDIVGGNNGKMLGGAGYRAGKRGKAFSFDGVDDLMEATTLGLPTGDRPRTFMMWVYVDEFVNQIGSFAAYGGSGEKTRKFGLLANGIYMSFTNWGRSWEAVDYPIELGRWHHLAVTLESGSISLYVDGRLLVTESVPIDTSPGSVFEAGGVPGRPEFMKGALDDIILYDRALSADEVESVYKWHLVEPLPVGYWAADGSGKDDGTGRNDATLFNGATYTTGIKGQAFSFDGVDDFVQTTTSDLPVAGSDRTMLVWARVDEIVAANGSFVGYGNFGTEGQAYQVALNGGTFPLFWNGGGGAGTRISIEKGRWYQIATTTENGITSLYVDGILAVGTTDVPIDTPADTLLYFGGIPGDFGKSRHIKGTLDEIAIYDRALSADEIQSLYIAHSSVF